MTTIQFRSDMDVELLKTDASDDWPILAAKVSTKGADVMEAETRSPRGFIDFLMEGRHGSPFEHVSFTWLICQPIFSWREFMRHRIASYNEESGRYKKLEPVFYVPGAERNLKQVGKPGAYEMVPGMSGEYEEMVLWFDSISKDAYRAYENMLSIGLAREVSRMVLPFNLYSSAFVTMNARALMNFLSLRIKAEDSMFPSFPQREIEMVAEKMEEDFATAMPHTHAAFVDRGRVAP